MNNRFHTLEKPLFSAAVLAVAALLLAGCAPKPAVVPTSFSKYTAQDAAFTCDAPAGWNAESVGGAGGTESEVIFTSGDGRISVDADAAGSFIGDAMAGSGATTPGAPAQIPPIEKLHAITGQKFASDLDTYTEITTVPRMLPYGDSRITEYTAKNVHGYRVTVMGRDRRVSIVCRCAPGEWAALQPAFARVIASVAQGSAQ